MAAALSVRWALEAAGVTEFKLGLGGEAFESVGLFRRRMEGSEPP